jgi:hypothetical protein
MFSFHTKVTVAAREEALVKTMIATDDGFLSLLQFRRNKFLVPRAKQQEFSALLNWNYLRRNCSDALKRLPAREREIEGERES